MKIGWMVAVLSAALAGAGATFVVEQLYWDNELKVQLAEKDRLIAELNADLVGLREGLGALQKTNADMRRLIDGSLAETADVAKSNQSSLEKVRSIIVRLQKLQTEIKASRQGATP